MIAAMTDIQKSELHASRPLSPHLQVYRLPMTAIMSISHRITGAILAGGCLLVTAFLVSAAFSAEAFECLMTMAGSWYGKVAIFGLLASFYYHFCNGIRHLIWDTANMLEKSQAAISGWVVLISTVALTLGTWFCSKMMGM
jgi:succinate dehydrogenase / fumarate reductase cytochrome b subunit